MKTKTFFFFDQRSASWRESCESLEKTSWGEIEWAILEMRLRKTKTTKLTEASMSIKPMVTHQPTNTPMP